MPSTERLRRIRRVAIAGLASVGAAVALWGVPTTSAQAEAQDGLHGVELSEGNIHGSSISPSGTVTFASQSIGSTAVQERGPGAKLYDRPVHTTINVNGDEVVLNMNPAAGRLDIHSLPSTLVTVDDKDALATASARLSHELFRPGTLPTNERAFILRNLSYLAEAPAGAPFPTTTTQTPRMPALFATCGQGGQAGPGPSTPGVRDVEPRTIVYLPCNASTVVTRHDGNHDYQEFTIRGGPSSGTTMGMCGAEGDPDGSGGWTQDCLDHDFCVQHDNAVPGTPVGVCGDEYTAASDDWASTSYCQCQGGAVCPPGYPPPPPPSSASGRASTAAGPDDRHNAGKPQAG